jgi:hypothetical protein
LPLYYYKINSGSLGPKEKPSSQLQGGMREGDNIILKQNFNFQKLDFSKIFKYNILI